MCVSVINSLLRSSDNRAWVSFTGSTGFVFIAHSSASVTPSFNDSDSSLTAVISQEHFRDGTDDFFMCIMSKLLRL